MDFLHISPSQRKPRKVSVVPALGFLADLDASPLDVQAEVKDLIRCIKDKDGGPFQTRLTNCQVRPFDRPFKFQWEGYGHKFVWEVDDRDKHRYRVLLVKCQPCNLVDG